MAQLQDDDLTNFIEMLAVFNTYSPGLTVLSVQQEGRVVAPDRSIDCKML
jgi:hypothetical protein